MLTGGIYAANTSTPQIAAIRAAVEKETSSREAVIQMHGFYVDEEARCVMFDLIIDFSADAQNVEEEILSSLKAQFPDWTFNVILDRDYSD